MWEGKKKIKIYKPYISDEINDTKWSSKKKQKQNLNKFSLLPNRIYISHQWDAFFNIYFEKSSYQMTHNLYLNGKLQYQISKYKNQNQKP